MKKPKLILLNPRRFMAKNKKISWGACIVWNYLRQDIQSDYLLLAEELRGGTKLARAVRLSWEDAVADDPELVYYFEQHPRRYIPKRGE